MYRLYNKNASLNCFMQQIFVTQKKQFFFDSYQKEQKKDHARRRILTRKLQLKLSKAFFVFFFF